ncbi:hypothetical protein S245_004140, partial [Arachis hypogaea]
LNYVKDSVGDPDVTIDSKLSIDILKNVMQLINEGCKAVVNYIREVSVIPFYWSIQSNWSIDGVYNSVAE